ncbi:MAG: peptidoglycan-binding domain-containing protein [Burkholderiales bacterium]
MDAKQLMRCAGAVSLALAISTAYAADNDTQAHPMTGKEKATAIGAGTGAVAGALVGGPVGAVVGGVAGGVIGHEGTDAKGRVDMSDRRTASDARTSTAMNGDTTVMNAQNALNSQGYDTGRADGVMGPNTRSALMKFQADHNLPQTGALDTPTLNALNTR